MRPSLRFLGLAVVGWIGVRAAALGMLPGGELFRIERGKAKTPAIVPTAFPPIEPVALASPETVPAQYPQTAYYPEQPVRPVMVPVYYPAPVSAPAAATPQRYDGLPLPPRRTLYASAPALDEMPMSRLAAIPRPV